MQLALRDGPRSAPRSAFGVSGGEGEKKLITVDAGFGDVPGIVGKRIGFIDEVAMRKPLLVAAFAPFRQILRLLPLCSKRSATFWK